MKFLSKAAALTRLAAIKHDLRDAVAPYESKARPCSACKSPGACCLDAHFVNVHISRLEAAVIGRTLDSLDDARQAKVQRRIDDAIATYQLSDVGDTFQQRYACPLFEPGIGCLVHHDGKPSACIVHACYESPADLPPDQLQQQAESTIDALNTRTYGRSQQWLPIPLALRRYR